MANITLMGATYVDVPAVTLPKTGGGTVTFYENGGGGSVTITDEANATGITCVITTSSEPTPTPSDIPLNTQLIDYTKVSSNTAIGSDGSAISQEWYYASDYTEVDPSMTFSYTAGYWFYVGVYDENKNVLRTIYGYTDGTQRQDDGNCCDGTLSGNKLLGAKYVRLCSNHQSSPYMSLIRTA